MRIFLIAFFLLNLLLSAFFVDTWITPNPGSRALPVLTLFEERTLRIDKYADLTMDKGLVEGHFYSEKAPLSTLIVAPFYGLLRLFQLDRWMIETFPSEPVTINRGKRIPFGPRPFTGYPVYFLGAVICGSIPFAALILISFLSIPRTDAFSPVWLTCLSFYGSFLFVFSGAYFGHLLAALFLLGSYLFLKKRRYVLSGLVLAAGFLTEYPVAIFFPFWFFQIIAVEKDWKKGALFALGMTPGPALGALYNFLITGSPFRMVYSFVIEKGFAPMKTHLGFGHPKIGALWDLLFSEYRGLLFYAPVLILMALVFFRRHAGSLHGHLLDYLTLPCAAFLLFISSYYMWWGGNSYGPRHLIPVTALLLYEGIRLLSRSGFSGYAFFGLSAAGILCAWLAKSTIVFYVPDSVRNPLFGFIIPQLMQGSVNENNLLTMLFNLRPLLSACIWLVFFSLTMFGLNRWYRILAHRVGDPPEETDPRRRRGIAGPPP